MRAAETCDHATSSMFAIACMLPLFQVEAPRLCATLHSASTSLASFLQTCTGTFTICPAILSTHITGIHLLPFLWELFISNTTSVVTKREGQGPQGRFLAIRAFLKDWYPGATGGKTVHCCIEGMSELLGYLVLAACSSVSSRKSWDPPRASSPQAYDFHGKLLKAALS